MQQSGHSLLLFCVPLCNLLSFHFHCCILRLESTLTGVKDLLFILLGFPRLASLKDRSPALSEPFVTLGFPIFFVYTLRIRVYTRDSLGRSTSGVQTFFFPGSHLRASRTFRVVGLLEEFCLTDTPRRCTRQHALAFTSK